MDTVTLWLASLITHEKVKSIRVAAGAVLGALISTVITALAVSTGIAVPISAISSLLMVLVSFGYGGIGKMLRRTSVVWTVGMLLGGIMTTLTSAGTSVDYTASTQPAQNSTSLILPAGILICAWLVYVWSRVPRGKTASVDIHMLNGSVSARGIVDTGNLLRDPVGGAPVVIVSQEVLDKLLPTSLLNALLSGDVYRCPEIASHITVIPALGIGGEAMLYALRPDSIRVNDRPVRAVVAYSRENLRIKSAECIVPAELL